MENRKSERVQFFQLGAGSNIHPVWVFRQTNPDAVLGLLLDIGADGAKILTDKAHDLAGQAYRLMIHGGNVPNEPTLTINGRCRWSQNQGTLYINNGLIFDETITGDELLELERQKREFGWLRCELLPLTNHPELQRHAV